MLKKQRKLPATPEHMNAALREAERALLIPEGLPNRPWFHHAIYAPGQYTGYAAVVIPGVNEAIDRADLHRTEQQIAVLAAALNRAVQVLEQYR
jgi:N-acetylated-alpha-linked acidic dipeptidase